MTRYLKLFFTFFRNCFMREMEFRFNLFTWTVMNFVYLLFVLLGTNLVFGQTSSIAGWPKSEVLLLVYTTALFNDLMWTFLMKNLDNFSDLVRNGKLDGVLLKPVSTRFMVSARYFEFDHYLRIPLLAWLIVHQANILNPGIGITNWIGFSLGIVSSLVIFSNFYFMVTTTNIWFISIFNLDQFFDEISTITRYPVGMFKKSIRLVLIYLIPTIFIAYIPVNILLGRHNLTSLIWSLGAGILLSYLSQKFWRFALKHYSSASS